VLALTEFMTYTIASSMSEEASFTSSTLVNVTNITMGCNIAASMVTNFLATFLIAYKLWLVNISLMSIIIAYS
jgi:hypothetical protein